VLPKVLSGTHCVTPLAIASRTPRRKKEERSVLALVNPGNQNRLPPNVRGRNRLPLAAAVANPAALLNQLFAYHFVIAKRIEMALPASGWLPGAESGWNLAPPGVRILGR